jgi:adenylate kinase
MADVSALEGASAYAEQHDLYRLFQRMMRELVLHKPADPLGFLSRLLQSAETHKVIIAGAPASGKGTQCELIVAKYGLVHISTGDLLREHVRQGTPLGRQADAFMSSGRLVPDELMIDIVKEKLSGSECAAKGWLLDGFPRTAAQARALQAAGLLADVVIILDVPEEVLIERVVGRRLDPDTGKIYHLKFSPPPADVVSRLIQRSDDTEEKARVRLRQYNDNLAAIIDCFASRLRRIDGNRAKGAVFDDVSDAIARRRPVGAPRQPPRVAVVGAPGASTASVAQAVAGAVGAEFVHAGTALRVFVESGGSGDAAELAAVREALEKGTAAPDAAVVRAVRAALDTTRVRTNGYVLYGFPRNATQAGGLHGLPSIAEPNCSVTLSADEGAVRSRLASRRFDPQARCFYQLDDGAPPASVADRLVRLPCDSEDAIGRRLAAFQAAAANVRHALPLTLNVTLGGDRQHAVEQAVEFITNPPAQ